MDLVIYFWLLLAGLGDAPADLLNLVGADQYFQARQIVLSEKNYLALAETEPVHPRAQVAQLLAIRWLGEHRVEAGRELLTRIASGKGPANDPHGFARDYAVRALAALDGKPAPVPPRQRSGVRRAGDWFPAGTFSSRLSICGLHGAEDGWREIVLLSQPSSLLGITIGAS